MKFQGRDLPDFDELVNDLKRQGKLRKDVLARVQGDMGTDSFRKTFIAAWRFFLLVAESPFMALRLYDSDSFRRKTTAWSALYKAAIPYTTGTVYKAILAQQSRNTWVTDEEKGASIHGWAQLSPLKGELQMVASLLEEKEKYGYASTIIVEIYEPKTHEKLYDKIMPDGKIQIILCGNDRKKGYLYSREMEDLYNLSTDPLPHNKKETI